MDYNEGIPPSYASDTTELQSKNVNNNTIDLEGVTDIAAYRVLRKKEHQELKKGFRTHHGVLFLLYIFTLLYIFGLLLFISYWPAQHGYLARAQGRLPWSMILLLVEEGLFTYNSVFRTWDFNNVGPHKFLCFISSWILCVAMPWLVAIGPAPV